MWFPRGLASLFNASKIHPALGTRTFQTYSGIMLFVEICFLLIMQFTGSDDKLDAMLMIILEYSFFTLGKLNFICYHGNTIKYFRFKFIVRVGTLTCIFCCEMGNIDEKEEFKFGWAIKIAKKYWAPAWQ